MATVERPPVNEVVVSISFDAQPQSTGPQLLISLADLLASFPSIQEQGPYEMPEELPPDEEVLKPAIPQFTITSGPAQIDRRYWLTAETTNPFLIQAQSNYFALNWRDLEGQAAYPGFDALESDFQRYLSIFERAVVSRGGEPFRVKQVEVTYINILRPDAVWSDFSELQKVVQLDFADLPRSEQVSLAFSTLAYDEVGVFSGRVHSSLQTGYQPRQLDLRPRPLARADLTPVINISISTRSARIKAGTSDLKGHLWAAHNATSSAFHALITDVALRNWGLK